MMRFKLGKQAPTPDSRDLMFGAFRTTASLPAHPKRFGHEKIDVSWQMLGNGPDDSVQPGFQGAGDCVFAGAAHETMLWSRCGDAPDCTFNGAGVIGDYSKVTGYVVGNDATDNGTNVRDALKYRQKTGIVDAHGNRHKIGAYLALEPGNVDHLLEALWLFGAVGIGINFPNTAMDQLDNGQPWSVVHGARIEGGHYIPLVAMRAKLECVTWGQIQPMTLGFYQKYCDEAWAILSTEMLKDGKTLEGFDLPALQSLLKQL